MEVEATEGTVFRGLAEFVNEIIDSQRDALDELTVKKIVSAASKEYGISADKLRIPVFDIVEARMEEIVAEDGVNNDENFVMPTEEEMKAVAREIINNNQKLWNVMTMKKVGEAVARKLRIRYSDVRMTLADVIDEKIAELRRLKEEREAEMLRKEEEKKFMKSRKMTWLTVELATAMGVGQDSQNGIAPVAKWVHDYAIEKGLEQDATKKKFVLDETLGGVFKKLFKSTKQPMTIPTSLSGIEGALKKSKAVTFWNVMVPKDGSSAKQSGEAAAVDLEDEDDAEMD